MPTHKEQLLTEPISRYIIGLVRKSSGSETTQLPGEMALCDKFHVGRGTVRRAMASLIRRGFVQMLPKRRGYFSNPAMAHVSQYQIGILVASGFMAAMAAPTAACFRGLSEKLEKSFFGYTFLSLHSFDPEVIEREIQDSMLDGVCWFAPEEPFVKALDLLSDKNFPTVSVENPYWPLENHPKCNFFAFDFTYSGEVRARYCLRHNCRRVFYSSANERSTARFMEMYREQGIPFSEKNIIREVESMEPVLKPALDRDQVDAVVCDGDSKRYLELFHLLAGHPNGARVRVLVEREPQEVELKNRFPGLIVEEIPNVDIFASSFDVGKRSADLLMQMILQKKTFQNPPEEYR